MAALEQIIPLTLIKRFGDEYSLIKRFGDEYREYKKRTGAFFPRLRKSRESL